jgi:lysozyme
LDVSRFQGEISFSQLATSSGVNEVHGVIARATIGVHGVDATFRRNLDGALNHFGIAGAYMVLHPGSSPRAQVDHFLQFTQGQYGNLPVAVDAELALGQSKSVITNTLLEVLQLLREATGKLPIIYTAQWFWGPNVHHTPALWQSYKHRLWVAHYRNPISFFSPILPEPWRSWGGDGHLLHQYTDQGRLPGVTANTVDLNRFNGSLNLLKQLAGLAPISDDAEPIVGPVSPVQPPLETRVTRLEERVTALENLT